MSNALMKIISTTKPILNKNIGKMSLMNTAVLPGAVSGKNEDIVETFFAHRQNKKQGNQQ